MLFLFKLTGKSFAFNHSIVRTDKKIVLASHVFKNLLQSTVTAVIMMGSTYDTSIEENFIID